MKRATGLETIVKLLKSVKVVKGCCPKNNAFTRGGLLAILSPLKGSSGLREYLIVIKSMLRKVAVQKIVLSQRVVFWTISFWKGLQG